MTPVDWLEAADRISTVAARRYPSEKVLFVSAATALAVGRDCAVGISLRRIWQRRGVVVFTTGRILFRATLTSPAALSAIGVACWAFLAFMRSYFWPLLVVAFALILIVVQRRPYEQVIATEEIEAIEIESVGGAFGQVPMMRILTRTCWHHFALSGPLPPAVVGALRNRVP